MQTIERQAALLRALSTAGYDGLPLRSLAADAGLPPSSTHRLLQGLAEVGLVAQEPVRHGYRLGSAVLRLAGAYLERVGFADVVLPYLEQISSETGTVAFSSVRDGEAVICTSVRAPRETTSFYVRIGKVLPWHASAAAKALIATTDDGTLRQELASRVGRAHTPKTLTTVEEVMADLARGRRLGYWECIEELEPDVYAVAAPVRTSRGRAVASLTAVFHLSRRGDERGTIARTVVAAAEAASREIAALLHAGQLMEAER